MREKKKIIFSIAIVAIILVILSIIIVNVTKSKENIATSANLQEIKTIKVNEVTRSVFYAPQYVAINNNYFKENGINIELTTGQRSRCCYDSSTIKSM